MVLILLQGYVFLILQLVNEPYFTESDAFGAQKFVATTKVVLDKALRMKLQRFCNGQVIFLNQNVMLARLLTILSITEFDRIHKNTSLLIPQTTKFIDELVIKVFDMLYQRLE